MCVYVWIFKLLLNIVDDDTTTSPYNTSSVNASGLFIHFSVILSSNRVLICLYYNLIIEQSKKKEENKKISIPSLHSDNPTLEK